MVKIMAIALYKERERDKPIRRERAVSLRELIRRCQGLAEGWP